MVLTERGQKTQTPYPEITTLLTVRALCLVHSANQQVCLFGDNQINRVCYYMCVCVIAVIK